MTTLADRVHQNMVEAFASLPAHQDDGFVQRITGLVVAVTGSPVALFNEVLPIDTDVEVDAVVDAVQRVRKTGRGMFLQMRSGMDDALLPVAVELGLDEEPDASWPAMALTELPTRLEASDSLEVRRVADDDGYAAHLRATGSDPALDATWLGRGLLDDPAWSLFVGYAHQVPVARSMAFCHQGVVGVYNVGTHASARRRGYGWAMTLAALVAGAEAGCSVATLQSSAMALSMYEAHGFRPLFGYRAFRGSAL